MCMLQFNICNTNPFSLLNFDCLPMRIQNDYRPQIMRTKRFNLSPDPLLRPTTSAITINLQYQSASCNVLCMFAVRSCDDKGHPTKSRMMLHPWKSATQTPFSISIFTINISDHFRISHSTFWIEQPNYTLYVQAPPPPHTTWTEPRAACMQQYVITIKQCSIIEIIEIEIVFGMDVWARVFVIFCMVWDSE